MLLHWTPEESFMYEFLREYYSFGSSGRLQALFDHCNPSELTRQLIRKDVLPFFFARLANGEVPLRLPSDLFRNWKILSGQMALHNMVFERECARLVGLFQAAGIRSVLLKGFSHAKRLYGDNSQRPLQDLDFLINAEDYALVKSLLLQDGYEYSATCDDGTPLAPAELTLWEQLLKEMHFSKVQGCYHLNIDMHWGFSALWWAPVRSLYPLDQLHWLQFTEKAPLLHTAVEWFTPELHFAQSIYHFALNNVFNGLKWFLDLCQYLALMRDQLDWELIGRFAPTRECKLVFWIALMLVFEVTGPLKDQKVDRFVRELHCSIPAPLLTLYKYRLFAGQSVVSKHVGSVLLPARWKDRLAVARFMLFDPAPMQLWNSAAARQTRMLQPVRIVSRLLRLARR